MNLKNSLLLVFILSAVLSCKEKTEQTTDREVVLSKQLIPYNSPLLDFDDPTVVVVDFRKNDAYKEGHLPGAINFYRDDFQDTTLPYHGMRIEKEQMAKRLGEAGITENHTLVVYDNKGSSDASRLWWLLRLYNFDKVYLLDGGLSYWERMGGKSSREVPEMIPASFNFSDQADNTIVIEKEQILNLIISEASKAILLDARSAEEYKGLQHKSGAKKAGRIPKSINIDWAEAIDYGDTYTFKSVEELEKIYGKLGASKEDTIIVYCHSGVRSSHTTFVLTQLLGYKKVLNYDGSWVEWSFDDLLPYESDTLYIKEN
ncbi:MAG: sulfurtransferase [Muriicola sp.]|nr:sulfurtransferase [Muriicola sp.]